MKTEIRIIDCGARPSQRLASLPNLIVLLASLASARGQFATSVEEYVPGTGTATSTNASAALGSPSRQTVDPDPVYGGTYPVDPFGGPYLGSQIVSVASGGSLTVRFATPIFNQPSHPYGLDFLIFGNAGFVITNGDFGGGGITDGTLYGASTGSWRISVSTDGQVFYPLDTSLAPAFDGLYPTDGQGDFGLPVNPTLTGNDFAGQGLPGIRNLYHGSGGGTGYDLAWARDTLGQPVSLDSASYVRVESLGGIGQIDGFSAVVPEPGIMGLVGLGILVLTARPVRLK